MAPEIGTLAANLLLAELLTRACVAFESRGIRACAIKGGALLATVYRDDPESRPMNDVDVIVEPGRLPEACSAAREELGLRWIPDSGIELEPPPGRPGHGVLRLDLHDRLHFGGASTARAALARAQVADRGGRELRVLDPCDQLLEVVAHACLHQFDLKPHQCEDLRRLAALCDPRGLRRRAARAGLIAPLRIAFDVVGCTHTLPAPHGLERLVDHFLRRRLTMRRPPGRSHLLYAMAYGDRRDLSVHLVRRARYGPAVAQLLDAGIDPRVLAGDAPGR